LPLDPEAPLRVGYGGGLFHPVTGYSLPIASRVALALAPTMTRTEAHEALATVARELAPQQSFGRLLNRLMFEAMMPARRWTALERFYRMPPATIARFYASRTTFWDRARLLVGRPPAGMFWRRLLASRRGALS
jgi:lycopene beta-cyclase